MGRSVLGGRNWEGFGPDPYLSGVAMHASVSGIQSVGVQACSKHLIGNEQETQRTKTTEDGTASFANAGLDLEMPGPVSADYGASYFGNYLLDAVNDDNVTESRLNEMVERVLTLYFFLHQHEDFP